MIYKLTTILEKETIETWYSTEAFARIAVQALDAELSKKIERKASIHIETVDHSAMLTVDADGLLIITEGFVIDTADEANRFGKIIADGLIAFLIDPAQF